MCPHRVVEFKMEESMKKAAEVLNKHSLGGRPLKVKEVRSASVLAGLEWEGGVLVKDLGLTQGIMDRKQDLTTIKNPSQLLFNHLNQC